MTGVVFRRVVNVLVPYDTAHGMEAHRVVEVEDGQANGKEAVDLGESGVGCGPPRSCR